MMLLKCLLFLSQDLASVERLQRYHTSRFQTSLMQRTVDINEIDHSTVNNVCAWRGVSCGHKGIINEISWVNADNLIPVVSFAHFPPTLYTLVVKTSKYTMKDLNTRRLPRSLARCFLHDCNCIGSVDLRYLPKRLLVFSIPMNSIQGTVDLSELPVDLKVLDMRHNPLREVIYDSRVLPKGLVDARFYTHKRTIEFFPINEIDPRIARNERQPDKYLLHRY